MDYLHIKKHLGERWLKSQLDFIKIGDWIERRSQKDSLIWMGEYTLRVIDELISRYETLEGFNKWTITHTATTTAFGASVAEIYANRILVGGTTPWKLGTIDTSMKFDIQGLSSYIDPTPIEIITGSP